MCYDVIDCALSLVCVYLLIVSIIKHMMEVEAYDDFILPNDTQVVLLDCKEAFNQLNTNEKLYAHYLSQAAWNGGLIVLLQTSEESALIFCLLHKLFSCESIQNLRAKSTDVNDDEFKALLVYCCGIFSNMGNYKSFGDIKFVPNLPIEKLESILKSSEAYKKDPVGQQWLWDNCKYKMYSLQPTHQALGFPEKGITTYFSSNCTAEDSVIVNEYFKKYHIEGYNCRTFKTVEGGRITYEIRFASVDDTFDSALVPSSCLFNNRQFIIRNNDYSPLLKLACTNLEKALDYAANIYEKLMISKYIESFKTGRLEDHKEGSRHWIKDRGPIIETYIGFIETYRDPSGIRGEFEGFVAMVNKEMSRKFAELVNVAKELTKKLPWGPDYDKDEFLEPDFTSLDVLTFAGSGIPAGINIPNYDEIRQEEGFKNVSLGNVIPATYKNNDFFFLEPEDQALMTKYSISAFEVQVGLHELLGHGSGKLFRHLKDGSFNFQQGKVIDPVTHCMVDSWYEEGETYDSVFTDISSSYEECRAECVGLYLCLDPDILSIFGHTGKEAEDIMYVNWLNLLWAGTGKALEMYHPESKLWLQAHSQARFVITQVILEAGEGLFTVSESKENEELICKLDREKIFTVGKRALGNFLLKLQTYKSTRNCVDARKMYLKYSEVNSSGPFPWACWRNIIMKHKKPRKMFVQCNTEVHNGDVILKDYEANHEGLIRSWIERFRENDVIYTMLIDLWKRDKDHFQQ